MCVQLREQDTRVTSRCIRLRWELLPTPHSVACNRNMQCSCRVDFSKIFLSAKREDLWCSHPRLLKHPRSTGAIKVMDERCATYVLPLARSQQAAFPIFNREDAEVEASLSATNAWTAVDWVRPKREWVQGAADQSGRFSVKLTSYHRAVNVGFTFEATIRLVLSCGRMDPL